MAFDGKRHYLNIRTLAQRINPEPNPLTGLPKIYPTIRRKAIAAWKSGKYGNLILNIGTRRNFKIIVEESILFDVVGEKPC